MSNSFTTTESITFTITHARYIASKVATDLKRMQRFYGKPYDSSIEAFEKEVAELLKHGYLTKVSYGFKKNGDFIEPTLIYTASELGDATDDDPGKIRPEKNVIGASFCSFLEYSDKWLSISDQERRDFEDRLLIKRTTAPTPGINGYPDDDLTYSAGGTSLSRSSVRSWS